MFRTFSMLINNMSRPDAGVLDVTKLKEKDKHFLWQFLRANPKQPFFPCGPNHIYEFNGRKFTLSHALNRSFKTIPGLKAPQIRYEVLQPLSSSGGFSDVFDRIGVLTLGKRSLRIKKDTTHVSKRVYTFNASNQNETKILNGHKVNSTSPEEIKREQRNLQNAYYFNPKRLTQYRFKTQEDDEFITASFLTMRKKEGTSLQKLIDNDKLTTLTPDKLLLLMIALLRALKEQVHDRGMVHLDLKPHNIHVNLETMEVTILDLGGSIKKNERLTSYIATGGYMSPEHKQLMADPSLDITLDESSDIFGMGQVFLELKNNMGLSKKDPKLNGEVSNLVLTKMKAKTENRKSIDSLIEDLHHLHSNEQHPDANPNQLYAAFELGCKTRSSLVKAKNPEEFLSILDQQLNLIQDNNPTLIKQFTLGLGWHSLADAKKKRNVLRTAEQIIHDHDKAINQYIDLHNEAIQLLEHYNLINKSEIFDELLEFIFELKHKINKLNQRPFDLDLLVKSTEALNKKFDDRADRLKEVIADIENNDSFRSIKKSVNAISAANPKNQTIDTDSISLTNLKNSFREVIRGYMKNTLTDENISKNERAASSDRQKDIRDFLKIINEARDPQTLVQHIEKRIEGMNNGFMGFFGFSGYSTGELKTNLLNVVNHYKRFLENQNLLNNNGLNIYNLINNQAIDIKLAMVLFDISKTDALQTAKNTGKDPRKIGSDEITKELNPTLELILMNINLVDQNIYDNLMDYLTNLDERKLRILDNSQEFKLSGRNQHKIFTIKLAILKLLPKCREKQLASMPDNTNTIPVKQHRQPQ